jgi:hypothetical protein
MGKPFQFSMRRMFLAVTCFAVSAAMIGVVLRKITPGERIHDTPAIIAVSALAVALITSGAGVGAIFGQAINGAIAAALCAIPVVVLLLA